MPDIQQIVEYAAGDSIPANCEVIEVHVAELKRLFNAIDSSPFREKDLDPNAEDFIVSWARDVPRDAPRAAGNVGVYAVQLAKRAGAEVIATAYTHDVEYVRTLHADHVIDVQTACFEERAKDVDVVIDTVGGETLDCSFEVLKPGGVFGSAVTRPDQDQAMRHRVRGVFVLVTVTTAGLTTIADLLDAGQLTTNVGEVLSFAEARLAHAILAGKPHKRGKIVLMLEA